MAVRDKLKTHTVQQQVWTRSVERSDGKAGGITVTCIVARETGAPKGVKPVEWRLMPNRPSSTLEQAVELIVWCHCEWKLGFISTY
jgi:hypothetical protein